MEQKQLDEIEDSFFGEEVIEEDYVDISKTKVKDAVDIKDKKITNVPRKPRLQKPVREMENNFSENIEPEVQITPVKEVKETKFVPKIEPKIDFKTEPKMDYKIDSKIETQKDSWKNNKDTNNETGSSFWKIISLLLIIALAISIWSNGFNFNNEKKLSIKEAQDKTLQYINTRLLQPPFVSEIVKSEEIDSLYKFTISVSGQIVDSYLTKDGKIFFPQGFDISGFEFKSNFSSSSDNSNDNKNELAASKDNFDVSLDDDPVKGKADAPITIIEFSDYQCSICAKFVKEVLPQMDKEYIQTGKVKLVFRDFPLEIHQFAQKASEAAECAGKQGKYWEMHDLLFKYQNKLDLESLKVYAAELGIEMIQFNKCLDKNEMADEVKKDFAEGKKYGLKGTPAFFINGKLIDEFVPYAEFKKEIETILNEKVLKENKVETGNTDDVKTGTSNNPPVSEKIVSKPSSEQSSSNKYIKTEINLNAKKWMFEPNKIKVVKNSKIKLNIVPEDLKFTFSAPDFEIEQEINGPITVELTADKIGIFEFKCSSCEAWRGMAGKIVVE